MASLPAERIALGMMFCSTCATERAEHLLEGDYGSPLIALNTLYTTLPPTQHHKVQLFCIEKKKRRAAHLRKLIAKTYPQFTAQEKRLYHASEGTFESTAEAYLHTSQPFRAGELTPH